MPACHKCAFDLNANTEYGRQDLCPKCRRPTRACLNCHHYDTARYNECAEPVADRVVEKEASNFCDYFKPGIRSDADSAASRRQATLKAAEALFKKGN